MPFRAPQIIDCRDLTSWETCITCSTFATSQLLSHYNGSFHHRLPRLQIPSLRFGQAWMEAESAFTLSSRATQRNVEVCPLLRYLSVLVIRQQAQSADQKTNSFAGLEFFHRNSPGGPAQATAMVQCTTKSTYIVTSKIITYCLFQERGIRTINLHRTTAPKPLKPLCSMIHHSLSRPLLYLQ